MIFGEITIRGNDTNRFVLHKDAAVNENGRAIYSAGFCPRVYVKLLHAILHDTSRQLSAKCDLLTAIFDLLGFEIVHIRTILKRFIDFVMPGFKFLVLHFIHVQLGSKILLKH